ncbi:MAG: hypothetical protein F6K08_03080 [Okeania sp. SIO1H6]|nr:hypothetical protein [Okeania sp. SIO1H6]
MKFLTEQLFSNVKLISKPMLIGMPISLAMLMFSVFNPIQQRAEATYEFAAIMYKHENYGGSDYLIRPNAKYRSLGWFNDKASSIRVAPGCSIKVYIDSDYDGPTKVFTESDSYIGDFFNDEISSVKSRCR